MRKFRRQQELSQSPLACAQIASENWQSMGMSAGMSAGMGHRMLPFKKPQIQTENPPPRWTVGIEKERVAMFVGIALVGGFLFGYATARFVGRAEETKAAEKTKAAETASAKTEVADPATLFYRVNRVLRADTVEVEGIGTVRLLGVETPDGKQPAETYAAHGRNAVAFTEKHLLNQEVRLGFDPAFAGRDNKDIAGQTLAYLYTRDGKLFNAELIRQGHAFVRKEQHNLAEDLHPYEREAIAVMRGLWGMDEGAAAAASTTAAAGTSTTSPTTAPAAAGGATKPGRLSPMAPGDIGPNIPAVAGATTAVGASEPMVFVAAAEKIYHKSGCELLGKKRQLLPLSQAKASGHAACGRCFPSTSMKAN